MNNHPIHDMSMRLAKKLRFVAISIVVPLVMAIMLVEWLLGLIYPHLDYPESHPWYVMNAQGVDPRWNVPDEELGFVRKPSIDWRGFAYDDPAAPFVHYRTDEYGFRNPPKLSEAAIAVIGDSFVEAGNVPEDDTFVKLCGEFLNVQAVNLGVASYGPQQELIVLRRNVERYSVRAVVWVVFGGNDIRDAQLFVENAQMRVDSKLSEGNLNAADRPEHSTVFAAWMGNRRITKMILRIIRDREARSGKDRELEGTYLTVEGPETIQFHYRVKPALVSDFPEAWLALTRSLMEGRHWCEERNIHLLVVFIPIKLRVMGPLTESFDNKLSWYVPDGLFDPEHDFASELRRFCEDQSFDCLDVTEALRESAVAGGRPYSLRFDTHLDIEGHTVVAAEVARRLSGLGLGPRPTLVPADSSFRINRGGVGVEAAPLYIRISEQRASTRPR